MKYFFAVFLYASSLFALNFNVTSLDIKNGQSAIITFEKDKSIVYKHVRIDDKRYKIFDNYVVIPIGYYAKPKEKWLIINYTQNGVWKSKIVDFNIVDGKYKKETIKVKSSKVTLSKVDKKRAAKEYQEAMDIYNTTTRKSYISSKFIQPIDSKITSSFGKARVYNNTLKGYHSGTDFRAKVGTPILVANDGKVVLVKDRFYSGGSIIVDHGYGLYTCYYHMSKFNVKVGQMVKKSQVIGLSGVSGRVTGPHLHYSIRAGGIQVDPLQITNLLNKEILQ